MQYVFDRVQALFITWALFLVAFLCIVLRLVIRFRIFEQLHFADCLAIISLFCLLGIDLILTCDLQVFDTYQNVTYFHHRPPPGYETTSATFEKLQWAIAYVYFTGLWAVKGVFLVCYGQLTQDLMNFRRAWWAIVTFVALTYLGCLIAYPLLNHPNLPHAGELKFVSIRYQFSVDLSTDVLIAALPITLICRVSIPFKRKLTVASVFTLSLISTIFAIARFVLNRPSTHPAGALWIVVWSNIELSVAVIVASGIVLRNLVVGRRGGTGSGRSGGHSSAAYEYRCKGGMERQWPSRRRPSGESQGVELLQRSEGVTSPKLSRGPSSKYMSGITEMSAATDEHGISML